MAIKFTVQGILIYATMAAYLCAVLAATSKRKRLSLWLYALGFIAAMTSFLLRWWRVGHVPLQNLFEVFLGLAMLMFPLSVFCRRYLKVGGEVVDMIIGIGLLIPVAFVFREDPHKLPPALQTWLFAPHVVAYMLGYVIMIKAAVSAAGLLWRGNKASQPGLVSKEEATYRLVCVGFPWLTVGLILGACWGKQAWGNYWNWDPKELWSLATWLVYVAYLQFRGMYKHKYIRVNALIAIVGVVFILTTLLWVNLASIFSGLHSYA